MRQDRHAEFTGRLIGSRPSMFVVGAWLHSKGYSVEIPAFHIAPSVAEYANFIDDGDVFAFVHRNVRHRHEVRELKKVFSSRADWPFPLERIYVDRKEKVDRAKDEVLAWVSVSPDYKALAVIPKNTSKHWKLVKVNNKLQGRVEETYSCPLEFAYFETLEPWGV